jgi:chemotaxis protein histidine kinase CheA
MIDSGDSESSVDQVGSLPPKVPADTETPRKRPPAMQAEETPCAQDERVSVRLGLLDQLINNMGEAGIYRGRMEQQNKAVAHQLEKFTQTVEHLQKQLRALERETESHVLPPALPENASDLSDIGNALRGLSKDVDTLLLQQACVINDLQDGLLQARMLPFTPAIQDVLLVKVVDKLFAIPHGNADWIIQATPQDLMACYSGKAPGIAYAGHEYALRYLGTMLGMAEPVLSGTRKWYPVLLVESGEEREAIQLDQLLGNFQVMVQPLGAQLGSLRWFTGGAILADGDIALLLDLNSLLRSNLAGQAQVGESEAELLDNSHTLATDRVDE